MIASRWMAALCAIALAACLAVLPGEAMAATPANAGSPALSAPNGASGLSGLVRKADTFPLCVVQRRCRTVNGQRRCGDVTRCQECSYQRQCDRQGCAWRQVCAWGPFKPVLKTN